MQVDVQALGRRLVRLRELKGLSMSAVATAAQIAKSYLAKLERGEVENPGLRTLDSVAQALGVTLGDLLAPAPAESAPPRATEATEVEEIAEFERMLSQLPGPLREFLNEMEQTDERLPADVVRSLASIQFRGRRPQTAADWRFIYEALNRTI